MHLDAIILWCKDIRFYAELIILHNFFSKCNYIMLQGSKILCWINYVNPHYTKFSKKLSFFSWSGNWSPSEVPPRQCPETEEFYHQVDALLHIAVHCDRHCFLFLFLSQQLDRSTSLLLTVTHLSSAVSTDEWISTCSLQQKLYVTLSIRQVFITWESNIPKLKLSGCHLFYAPIFRPKEIKYLYKYRL